MRLLSHRSFASLLPHPLPPSRSGVCKQLLDTDDLARPPHAQAIAVSVVDATRSLQANEKPMTQEQRRAILEQVRAAQDPRCAPCPASAPVWLRHLTIASMSHSACSRSGAAGQAGREALTALAQVSRQPGSACGLQALAAMLCAFGQLGPRSRLVGAAESRSNAAASEEPGAALGLWRTWAALGLRPDQRELARRAAAVCRPCRKPRRGSWTVGAAPSDDPYSLLNVSRGASRDEVSSASGQDTYRLRSTVWGLIARRLSCACGTRPSP